MPHKQHSFAVIIHVAAIAHGVHRLLAEHGERIPERIFTSNNNVRYFLFHVQNMLSEGVVVLDSHHFSE